MAEPNVTQEVFFEMLEKLPDGTFKIKYPKTIAEQVIGSIDAGKLGGLLPSDFTRIIEGSYIGDGIKGTRFINIGATPKLVILSNQYNTPEGGYFALMAAGWARPFYFTPEGAIESNHNVCISTNGFTVFLPSSGSYIGFGNVSNVPYKYISFI